MVGYCSKSKCTVILYHCIYHVFLWDTELASILQKKSLEIILQWIDLGLAHVSLQYTQLRELEFYPQKLSCNTSYHSKYGRCFLIQHAVSSVLP